MLPYLLVFTICILLHACGSNKNLIPICISCLLLSLLAGLRDVTIGADTDFYPHWYISELSHIKSFSDIVKLETDLDKGFLTLYWISSWFGKQYWVGLFFVELLITTFTFLAYIRLRKHFHNGLVVFTIAFLFLIYNYTLNAMRQECAISIAFFAFSYLWEKKWLNYLLWTLVAFTFHSSAIISLIIPLFYMIASISNKKEREWITFFLIASLVLIFFSFYQLLGAISGLGLFNEVYATRYGENGAFEGNERVAYAPVAISLIIYFIMGLSFRKNIIDEKLFTIHCLLNTIYFFSLFLATLSEYLYRIGLYFFIIDIYFFSIELSDRRIKPFFRLTVISIIVFYWFFNYVIKNNSETYPYTSKILGIY